MRPACLLPLVLALLAPASARAQVAGPPYLFTNFTLADANEVNANFAAIYNAACNRTGCTMSGPLIFSPDNSIDIGASGTTRPRDLFLGRNATIGGTLTQVGAATFTAPATFTGAIAANGGIVITSTTAPQLSTRYDPSNRLDVSVSSAGLVTFDAVGASAGVTFSDDVIAAANLTVTGITFTLSSVNPIQKFIETDGAANGQRYRTIANGGLLIYQTCTDVEVCSTAFSYPNVAGVAAAVDYAVPIRAAAGSLGTPSISFTGDPDTGFVNTGANTITFVAGGAIAFATSAAGTFFTSRVEAAGAFAPAEVAFASLPASPNDGDLYFCNNCTIANPCAGAGTGAYAKRLNGVWVCN